MQFPDPVIGYTMTNQKAGLKLPLLRRVCPLQSRRQRGVDLTSAANASSVQLQGCPWDALCESRCPKSQPFVESLGHGAITVNDKRDFPFG